MSGGGYSGGRRLALSIRRLPSRLCPTRKWSAAAMTPRSPRQSYHHLMTSPGPSAVYVAPRRRSVFCRPSSQYQICMFPYMSPRFGGRRLKAGRGRCNRIEETEAARPCRRLLPCESATVCENECHTSIQVTDYTDATPSSFSDDLSPGRTVAQPTYHK